MDPDDVFPRFDKKFAWLMLVRLQLLAIEAVERELQKLEARVGRKLPAVRAQLEQLAATPELPALPPAGIHTEPEDEHASPGDGLSQRKRGRPKKQRDADESDAPGTELS